MEPPAACAQSWTRSLASAGRALRFLAGGIRADAPAMVLAR